MEGMVNVSEPLCKRRNIQQAKEAERLGPKGMWPGRSVPISLLADVVPPAQRRSLIPPGMVLVRNALSPTVSTGQWKDAREGGRWTRG